MHGLKLIKFEVLAFDWYPGLRNQGCGRLSWIRAT